MLNIGVELDRVGGFGDNGPARMGEGDEGQGRGDGDGSLNGDLDRVLDRVF
jgi:hypothetical protein